MIDLKNLLGHRLSRGQNENTKLQNIKLRNINEEI